MGKDPYAILKHENAKLTISLQTANNTIIERDMTIIGLKDKVLKLESDKKRLEMEREKQETVLQSALSVVSNQRSEIIGDIQKSRVIV